MNYHKLGFTQKKPKVPGAYLISSDCHRPLDAPRRLQEGWEIANIIFYAGSFSNVNDNREDCAHWLISTLSGLNYGWRKGMWTKGPISPDWAAPVQTKTGK
jgi:hypothetical protein